MPNDRSKIAHEKELILPIPAVAEETNDASLKIFAIDPLETSRIKVRLVQQRLAAVQSVEVTHPALQSRVKRLIQEMPIKACVVIPLRPLAKFVAHEQKLLSGVAKHKAVEQPQVCKFLK